MPLLNNNPTKTTAWKKLAAHFEEMSSFSLEKAFRENPNRKDDFSICMDDLTVDFSKNRIQQRTIDFLLTWPMNYSFKMPSKVLLWR